MFILFQEDQDKNEKDLGAKLTNFAVLWYREAFVQVIENNPRTYC